MDSHSSPAYIALLFLSGGIALLIALLAYQRRRSPGGMPLMLLMISVMLWNWMDAFSWFDSPGRPVFFFWKNVSIVGSVIAPVFFFIFAVELTNRIRWLSRTSLALLGIVPAVTAIMFWIDPYLQLFYGNLRDQNANGLFVGGPFFWVNTVYSYVLILTSFFLLIQFLLKQQAAIYRKQIGISVLGMILLVVIGTIHVLNIRPLPALDLTPIAFTLTGLFFAYSIVGYHMLDIIPVSLGTLIDQMSDGLIVVDAKNRIVEINRTAAEELHGDRAHLIGVDLETINRQGGIELCLGQPSREIQIEGSPSRVLEIASNPLYGQDGRPQGYLLTSRDVTRLKKVEEYLRSANETLQDQLSEIEALQDTLRDQAIRDPLTGLYNRRYLEEVLPKEIARAERLGMPLAFVMIDLDHFKAINDTYGHDVGDSVLQKLAGCLESSLRKGDVVARIGGDEFLAIMIDSSQQDAYERAEEIRAQVEEIPCPAAATPLKVNISIGIAVYPTHGQDAAGIIQASDRALYQAKAHGRNAVCLAR